MSIITESQDKKTTATEDRELDLGTTLTVIAKGFNKLGYFFTRLWEILLNLLVFLKRRLWWLLLAAVVGLGWGIYKNMSGGDRYTAEMTARFNHESPVVLYGSIDYLNELISDERYNELATLFSISKEEAMSLQHFLAAPIEDPLVISELYKQQYLNFDRTMLLRQDTLWNRIISFSEFKKKLTKYNIPLQKITVMASRPGLFASVQKGLINMISSNTVLQKNQLLKEQFQDEEEHIILSSLHGLDTLRTAYLERIRNTSKRQENSSTNISLIDQSLNASAPELVLFDKELSFRDELRKIKQSAMNNQGIVQVYVPFNQYGKRFHPLITSYILSALKAILILLFIFLVIELYQFIAGVERAKKSVTSR